MNIQYLFVLYVALPLIISITNYILIKFHFQDEEFTAELGPSELRFLLEDVLQKMEYVIFKNKKISHLSKMKAKDTVGFTSVSLVPAKTILKNFIKLLPYLITNLTILSEFFKVKEI